MAAIVGDGACDINKEDTIKLIANVLNGYQKTLMEKLFFFSTCSVYGAQKGILDENSKLNPFLYTPKLN